MRAACRALGIDHSTFYRWKKVAECHGLELLRPRERRAPAMPNQTSPMIVRRVLGFALAHLGYGPQRIASEMRRTSRTGFGSAPTGSGGCCAAYGLGTRAKRLAHVAGYSDRPEPVRPRPQPVRHIAVSRPGQLVQMDCFFIGRLSGTRGSVWQYTAIDAYSSYPVGRAARQRPQPRCPLHLGPGPSGGGRPGRRRLEVGGDQPQQRLGVQAPRVRGRLAALGDAHRSNHAGRPQSNGFVERAQLTVLDECWRPAFARYLIPKLARHPALSPPEGARER